MNFVSRLLVTCHLINLSLAIQILSTIFQTLTVDLIVCHSICAGIVLSLALAIFCKLDPSHSTGIRSKQAYKEIPQSWGIPFKF
jgi:hypothetical protein